MEREKISFSLCLMGQLERRQEAAVKVVELDWLQFHK